MPSEETGVWSVSFVGPLIYSQFGVSMSIGLDDQDDQLDKLMKFSKNGMKHLQPWFRYIKLSLY